MGERENQQIRQFLEENAEETYRKFSAGLIPGAANVLGVRLKKLREMAKQLAKGDWRAYLEHATDDSMEEIMLQGMTLGYLKVSFKELCPYLEGFLPKIDNWSVCDSTCAGLKIAKKEPQLVREYLQTCLDSVEEYRIRFGVVMLLNYYIVPEYITDVLEQLDKLTHPGYYAKMAVAWNLSMCYIRFPEQTLNFLQKTHLDDWTYNKAIQKMLESYRVNEEERRILRTLKR